MLTKFQLVRTTSYFSFLSAGAHFATLIWWDRYTADLAKGMNRFRWIEYSMSASLIMTLLFALWGNLDFVQLSGCFMTNVVMIWFGDMHEVINAGRKPEDVDWTSFWYGGFCGIVPWLMMFYQIIRIPDDNEIPWWVWLIVFLYFFLFFTFPGCMLVQYLQWGKWSNDRYPLLKNGGYLQGERTYQKLSLFTKSLILWSVALAFMNPEQPYADIGDDYRR